MRRLQLVTLGALFLALGIALGPAARRNFSNVRILRVVLGLSRYAVSRAAQEPSLSAVPSGLGPGLPAVEAVDPSAVVLLPPAFSGPSSNVIRAEGPAPDLQAGVDVLVMWTYSEATALAKAMPGLYLVQVTGRGGSLPPVQVLLRADRRSLGVLTFESAEGAWEPRVIPLFIRPQNGSAWADHRPIEIGLVFLNDYVGDLGDRNAEIARVDLIPLATGWQP